MNSEPAVADNGTIIHYLVRKELELRSLETKENAYFRIGRKTIKLDFYLPREKAGIVLIDWRRSIPTNKLLQLENIINAMNLKRLVLICNGISNNAKEFLERRNIPINVIYFSEIIEKRHQLSNILNGG